MCNSLPQQSSFQLAKIMLSWIPYLHILLIINGIRLEAMKLLAGYTPSITAHVIFTMGKQNLNWTGYQWGGMYLLQLYTESLFLISNGVNEFCVCRNMILYHSSPQRVDILTCLHLQSLHIWMIGNVIKCRLLKWKKFESLFFMRAMAYILHLDYFWWIFSQLHASYIPPLISRFGNIFKNIKTCCQPIYLLNNGDECLTTEEKQLWLSDWLIAFICHFPPEMELKVAYKTTKKNRILKYKELKILK